MACSAFPAPDWLIFQVLVGLGRIGNCCRMFKSSDGWLQPAFYMVIAVASFSALPVLLKLGDAEESPFLFASIWLGSLAMKSGAEFLVWQRRLPPNTVLIKDIIIQCKTRLMLASVLGHSGFALFALGLAFVNVSIAAILYGTWPLFLFFFFPRINSSPIVTLAFVFIAIISGLLVIISHNDILNPWLAIADVIGDSRTLLGVILVLMAAGCVAVSVYASIMGALRTEKHLPTEDRETAKFAFTTATTSIGMVIASVVLCMAGLIASETISLHQLIYAALGGPIVNLIGTVAFRAASSNPSNFGANALSFAHPLVTLLWLWLLSLLHVPHLDYLIIGTMGIVASTLLSDANPYSRFAYVVFAVSLWGSGTVVYFFEGFSSPVSLELPVTVFILILAFRLDRLVQRTGQEEEWVFDVFHKLESLTPVGQPDSKVSKTMREASQL